MIDEDIKKLFKAKLIDHFGEGSDIDEIMDLLEEAEEEEA